MTNNKTKGIFFIFGLGGGTTRTSLAFFEALFSFVIKLFIEL